MSIPAPAVDLLGDMIAEGELAIVFLEGRSLEAFTADAKTVHAVLHAVQTVGEAAYKLAPEVKARMPDIPWEKIIRMRHLLVHHYAKVSLDVVWATVTNNLPALLPSIGRLRDALVAENPPTAEGPPA